MVLLPSYQQPMGTRVKVETAIGYHVAKATLLIVRGRNLPVG